MVSPDRASALHKSSFRHEAIKHATFEGDNPTLAALASRLLKPVTEKVLREMFAEMRSKIEA